MLRKKTTIDGLEIMKEIKRNNTKEWKVVQAWKKNDISWEENRIVYIEERIYVKIARSGLSFLLFSFIIFIFFLILFYILYLCILHASLMPNT